MKPRNTNTISNIVDNISKGQVRILPQVAKNLFSKDGKIGINTSTPDYTLDVNGDLRVTGNSLLEGGITGSIAGYTLSSEWKQNGFENRTDSTLTWTDTSPDRTLSIQPVASSFTYWIEGVRYDDTGSTVQITDIEGMHVVYFEGTTLTAMANPTSANIDTLIRENSLVSMIYWDTSESTAIYVGEERHGKIMTPSTHSYLHFLEGMRYVSGLGLNTINADGSGATADAQFGVDSGSANDEDLHVVMSSIASTVGLPIYYMLGADSDWQKHTESGFSVRTSDGTSATRLAYNEYTGGAWQLTQVTSGKYVLCHVFATTEKDLPMISIMGQDSYLNKIDARAGALTEIKSLILNDILFPEIRPIATVILQTNTSYASAVNARVISTDEGDDYIDWRSETVSRVSLSTSDHGSMSGLGDNDHPHYLLVVDIDDSPVNGEVAQPISSNWAFDHVAAADPHTVYRLESADHSHQSTGLQAGKLDHGLALNGLTDDDHTNYILLAGRAGGQVLTSGTGAGDNFQIRSTSSGTKGKILFGASAYDEVNNRLGVGLIAPAYKLDVYEGGGASYIARLFNDGDAAARQGIFIQCGLDAGAGSGDTTRYISCQDGDGNTVGFIAESNHIFALTDICDEKVKENIVDTQVDALNIVNGFVMKDFDKVGLKKKYKSPKRCDFIAQNCKSVFPEMVVDQVEEEGLLYINRSAVISILVKAVQQLSAKIDVLENKNNG